MIRPPERCRRGCTVVSRMILERRSHHLATARAINPVFQRPIGLTDQRERMIAGSISMASCTRCRKQPFQDSSCRSSVEREICAAATFSSRCASDDVPGMGTMTGERASSQAIATCTSVAPRRRRRPPKPKVPSRGLPHPHPPSHEPLTRSPSAPQLPLRKTQERSGGSSPAPASITMLDPFGFLTVIK